MDRAWVSMLLPPVEAPSVLLEYETGIVWSQAASPPSHVAVP
jgi:hypothetical protein